MRYSQAHRKPNIPRNIHGCYTFAHSPFFVNSVVGRLRRPQVRIQILNSEIKFWIRRRAPQAIGQRSNKTLLAGSLGVRARGLAYIACGKADVFPPPFVSCTLSITKFIYFLKKEPIFLRFESTLINIIRDDFKRYPGQSWWNTMENGRLSKIWISCQYWWV